MAGRPCARVATRLRDGPLTSRMERMGRTSDAKERLIHTAVGLIRARSYAAVSVDDLCRGAGVRKGSFYHFFPSKRDLALAALDSWWESTRTELLEPTLESGESPLARITRVFERVVGQQERHKERSGRVQGCPLGNMALELSAQDEVVRARLEAIFVHFAQYFERLLEEARRAGEVPAATEVATTAKSLLAYLYGALLMAKTADDLQVMRDLTARALRLVHAPGA